MKFKQTELDVDFIGGMGPLTKDEERAIGDFIKADKLKRAKSKARLAKRKPTGQKRKSPVTKAK